MYTEDTTLSRIHSHHQLDKPPTAHHHTTAMKPKYLLPLAALLIAAVFLSLQRQQIQQLKETNAKSRDALNAAAQVNPSQRSSLVRTPARIKSEIRHLAPMVRIWQWWEGPDTPPEVMDFVIRIREMDAASLLATLDLLDTMDLDGRSRDWFEDKVVKQLTEKYPEALLNHCKERMCESEIEHRTALGFALYLWTKADSAAATAWLDREIAAGTFETKGLDPENWLLAKFEGTVLAHRMSIDPHGSIARLTARPTQTQIEILKSAAQSGLLSPEQKKILTPLALEMAERYASEEDRDVLHVWYKQNN